MSTFTTLANSGQTFAELLMGEAFTLGGTSYTGVINFVTKDLLLESQGIRSQVDAILVANKSQFSSDPAVRDEIVYDSVTFSVRDVQEDNQAFTLQLKKLA